MEADGKLPEDSNECLAFIDMLSLDVSANVLMHPKAPLTTTAVNLTMKFVNDELVAAWRALTTKFVIDELKFVNDELCSSMTNFGRQEAR